MKFSAIQTTSLFILIISFALPAIAGDNICPPPPDPPELIYDPANPTSMDPGTTENIRVIGGVEPLTWTSSNPDYMFTYQNTIDRVNPLTSALTTCDEVTVTISDSRINPYNGSPNPQQVSGKLNKPFIFDWGPEDDLTIGTFETVEVSIKGGVAPFTWTISGADFYFVDELNNQYTTFQSDSRTVYIFADQLSCAADITVTDSCGEIVNGSIRNVNNSGGTWILIEDIRNQAQYPGEACGVEEADRTGIRFSHWWAAGGYYYLSYPYRKGKYRIHEERLWAAPWTESSCIEKSVSRGVDLCQPCVINVDTCQDMGMGGEWPTCTWKGNTYKMQIYNRQKQEWICD